MTYFAYGSNMPAARLSERVGLVRMLGPATLPRHRLAFHKRGQDGSGKCDIIPAEADAVVHGALYSLTAEQWGRLGDFERGYGVAEVALQTQAGALRARTYVAERDFIDASLAPFDWYRDLVAHGALTLGFPRDYVERIRAVRAIKDADERRCAIARRILQARVGEAES